MHRKTAQVKVFLNEVSLRSKPSCFFYFSYYFLYLLKEALLSCYSETEITLFSFVNSEQIIDGVNLHNTVMAWWESYMNRITTRLRIYWKTSILNEINELLFCQTNIFRRISICSKLAQTLTSRKIKIAWCR